MLRIKPFREISSTAPFIEGLQCVHHAARYFITVISFTSMISQFAGKYYNHFIEEETQVQLPQAIYPRSQK